MHLRILRIIFVTHIYKPQNFFTMSHYKEYEKIRRKSGGNLYADSTIYDDFRCKVFKHDTYSELHGRAVDRTSLTIKKDHGAGLMVEVTKYGEKRTTSQFIELGKSDIEMLLRFIDSVKDDLRDYNGEFVPVQLTDLTPLKP